MSPAGSPELTPLPHRSRHHRKNQGVLESRLSMALPRREDPPITVIPAAMWTSAAAILSTVPLMHTIGWRYTGSRPGCTPKKRPAAATRPSASGPHRQILRLHLQRNARNIGAFPVKKVHLHSNGILLRHSDRHEISPTGLPDEGEVRLPSLLRRRRWHPTTASFS